MPTFEDLSRQRLDFSVGPRGETIAHLTVTLGDGSVHRYMASTDDAEIEALGAAFGTVEVRRRGVEGQLSEEEIAGIFSAIGKALKKVANVAKKVASSKVFKMAGKGIAALAPALGPFAPAAMGVSAGMQIASKLSDSAIAAEAGAKRAARALAKGARKLAGRFTRGKSKPRRKLMNIANRKRKAAMKLAGRKKKRRKKKKRKKKMTAFGILAAAKRGKLRSNKKGSVTPRDLGKAAKRGRIYWLAA